MKILHVNEKIKRGKKLTYVEVKIWNTIVFFFLDREKKWLHHRRRRKEFLTRWRGSGKGKRNSREFFRI